MANLDSASATSITKTYRITGMTCGGCEAKVKNALEAIPHVSSVVVSHKENNGILSMDEEVPFATIRRVVEELGDKYEIDEQYTFRGASAGATAAEHVDAPIVESRTWFETYKPVILLFIYIGTVSTLVELTSKTFSWMNWMRWFMAGFFLAFSFFKFLDLKGFATSYRMYDVVAKKFPVWGYIYAYTELLLGVAYLIGFNPLFTSLITFTVMSVSIVGVLQKVLNKQVIQCACLGKVFDLPMSTVTIIEDGLMIMMAAVMILTYLY